MLCAVMLRATGIGMRQTMSTVTAYHFTGQAMCLVLSLRTCTDIFFSHSCRLLEILFTDNGNMTILHTLPIFFRKGFGMLVTYIFTFKSVINHGAGVLLIFKDSAHCHIAPEFLFLTVFRQLIFIVLTGGRLQINQAPNFYLFLNNTKKPPHLCQPLSLTFFLNLLLFN